MSEPKFTPGPWVVNTDHEQLGDITTIDRSIGVAYAQQVSNNDRLNKHVERKANAHLISAAPEMYDLIRQFIEGEYKEYDDDFDYYKFIGLMLDKFEDVLKKARGEK